MDATSELIKGIATIPDLRILGNPDLSVVRFSVLIFLRARTASLTALPCQVCFDAPKLDTLRIGDEMGKLGWSLNALQSPTCLHICLTGIHTRDGVISSLVADLRSSVLSAADGPPSKDGMGAIYGMTGSVPTSMVRLHWFRRLLLIQVVYPPHHHPQVESLTTAFIDVLYTA